MKIRATTVEFHIHANLPDEDPKRFTRDYWVDRIHKLRYELLEAEHYLKLYKTKEEEKQWQERN